MDNTNETRKEAYRLRDFCKAYAIGRNRALEELKLGRLRSYRIGKQHRITRAAAQEWLKSLEEQNQNTKEEG